MKDIYEIFLCKCGRENSIESTECVKCGGHLREDMLKFVQNEVDNDQEEKRYLSLEEYKDIERENNDIAKVLLSELNTLDKLMECPDCLNKISRRAAKCVHCGRPMNDNICSIVNMPMFVSKDELNKLEILSKYFSKDNNDLNTEKNIKEFGVCPQCGSNSYEKTSVMKKVGMVALIGAASAGTISKTFKCNNCGYSW